MLRQRFEFIFRPGRHGMDRLRLVTHEIQPADWDGDGLCSDPEETTNVNYHLRTGASTVKVRHMTDLLVARPIDRRALKVVLCKFVSLQSYVIGMIHFLFSFLGGRRTGAGVGSFRNRASLSNWSFESPFSGVGFWVPATHRSTAAMGSCADQAKLA
jgi:hypothetical protein